MCCKINFTTDSDEVIASISITLPEESIAIGIFLLSILYSKLFSEITFRISVCEK